MENALKIANEHAAQAHNPSPKQPQSLEDASKASTTKPDEKPKPAQTADEQTKAQEAAKSTKPHVATAEDAVTAPGQPPVPVGPQGSCSTITGLGGGGGSPNCTPSTGGTSPSTQALPNPGQSQQIPQPQISSNPDIQKLRDAQAAVLAARTAAELEAAEKALAALQNLPTFCPPVGSSLDPEYADYCAKANCVERGTAYYGSICSTGTETSRLKVSKQDAERVCKEALAQLSPRAPNEKWLVWQLARGDVHCNVDGSRMTLREMLALCDKWGNDIAPWCGD